jgi:hypothetical protein
MKSRVSFGVGDAKRGLGPAILVDKIKVGDIVISYGDSGKDTFYKPAFDDKKYNPKNQFALGSRSLSYTKKLILQHIEEILQEGVIMSNFAIILEQLNEAVEIDLTPWQISSGKKQPGASNRGSWIFTVEKDTDVNREDEGKTYMCTKGSTLFADAKKQAKEWAKSKGYSRIYVAG